MDAEDPTAPRLRRRAPSSSSILKDGGGGGGDDGDGERVRHGGGVGDGGLGGHAGEEAKKQMWREEIDEREEEEKKKRRQRQKEVEEKKRDVKEASAPASSSSSSESRGIAWGTAFLALLLLRHASAKSNLVHDCDEVFNYWEPLHHILYGSGFQTWEYSSEFALRSYLYLLLHAVLGGPASWWYGAGEGKVYVFFIIRHALGILSAGSEAALVAAMSKRYGKRIAAYTLMLLCFSSGCFNASTSFLPSTFSMYTMTLAVAAAISGNPHLAVVAAASGVLIGWPFSVLATAPIVIYSLLTGGFVKTVLIGVATCIGILIPSILADRLFYGKWTMSVFNLVLYNVFGGGDSTLYGVESSTFYFRNGFNNFNFAFPLALLLPIVVLVARKRTYISLLIFALPLYIWLGFMSLQPHKEERFLYPVYTIICIAAAGTIELVPELLPKNMQNSDSILFMILKIIRPMLLGVILVTSYSRVTSLLNGYSAPMKVLTHLPSIPNQNDVNLCIGNEWHRFPSSFFLPSPNYQVKWLDDGFRGLLPLPFNDSLGGSAAAPSYFNKLNQASENQYIRDIGSCSFLVELDFHRENVQSRGSNRTMWEVIVELPFLDNERSPPLHRAFFIPWMWHSANTFGAYRLLRRKVQ